MRILPSDEHQIRKERILQAVIHLFIKTGKPVGSTTIVDNFNLNLSPASIRHVLAELEKNGFLTHPHTSAGRIPTDLGYRFYVNSIAKIQRLAEEEQQRIEYEYLRKLQAIEGLMTSTTRILSTLSHCAGFALRTNLTDERIRRVDLIPVNLNQLLAVMVSESGTVRNQMIPVKEVPAENDIRFMSKFLSEKLKGLSFSQAQSKLKIELTHFNSDHKIKKDTLEQLKNHLFENIEPSSLFVDGTSNVLQFPEFSDLKSVRNFASLVDHKETLSQILNKELDQKGLQVRIGAEDLPELEDFSVVSSSYFVKGRPLGVLGILGPKRMEYERMMAIVNTVADLVNRFIEKNDTELLDE